ncbi:MAG TPA: alpha/beta hydrolase [Dehalococcoidia bacterium]|nr:alpha/beta hydrolase [Dehalococcoidia bacterium]
MASNVDTALRVEKDITFAEADGRELKLDLYYPNPALDKRTAVVQLYGGGFTRGSKDGRNTASAALLAERGYLGICTTYRLSDEAKWPSQLHDVKATIRWARAHAAEIGFEPNRLTLAGYSAGALLALVAAGTGDRPEFEGGLGPAGISSAVAAIMVHFPGLIRRQADGSDHHLMPPGSDAAAYTAADPLTHIGPSFPPAIFFHGTADDVLPHTYSVDFSEKLRAAGVATEYHVFDAMPHIFDKYEPYGKICADLSDAFLDRTIVEPRSYPRP